MIWNVTFSVFKNYCQDSKQLLSDALSYDLSKAKLANFVIETDQIITLLQPIFRQLKETHKHICGVAWDN